MVLFPSAGFPSAGFPSAGQRVAIPDSPLRAVVPLSNLRSTRPISNRARTRTKLSGWLRLGLLTLGIVLAGLLTTARLLEPDPAGFGTHQQLGLAECTMARLIGRPCPSCGMTTAWAYLVRGNFVASADANLGGLITCLLAVVVCPWAIASAVLGRWWPAQPVAGWFIGVAIAVVLITLTDWFVGLLG